MLHYSSISEFSIASKELSIQKSLFERCVATLPEVIYNIQKYNVRSILKYPERSILKSIEPEVANKVEDKSEVLRNIGYKCSLYFLIDLRVPVSSNRLYIQIMGYLYGHRSTTPYMRVARLKLMLEQGLHKAHDFKALFFKSMELDHAKYIFYSDSNKPHRPLAFYPNQLSGGGKEPIKKRTWSSEELQSYTTIPIPKGSYKYVSYVPTNIDKKLDKLHIEIPLNVLINKLKSADLKDVGIAHGLSMWRSKYISLPVIQKRIQEHNCNDSCCLSYYSVFESNVSPKSGADRIAKLRKVDTDYKVRDQDRPRRGVNFPPTPPSNKLMTQIIQEFCAQSEAENLEEIGCAVCGQLKKKKRMTKLADLKVDLDILENDQITRRLRTAISDPISFLKGPVLDDTCQHICPACVHSLSQGKAPEDSLSNGLWLGTVPPELKDLSWTEKLLVARVIHNYCVIRVASSGSRKLKANAICHSMPTPKIYTMLPPPRKDLDLVLSCIFIGPTPPTAADYKRTPFLVRHNKVATALEWLRLNHIDYADIGISYKNLKEYSESEPPVHVIYQKSEDNSMKESESTAVNDNGDEEATSEGQCPFVVHGLTGEQLTELMKQDPKKITAKALHHFKNHGHTLGIGQSDTPESLYDNPQLYPQMFPWLFPYGLGGIGNDRGFKPLWSDL